MSKPLPSASRPWRRRTRRCSRGCRWGPPWSRKWSPPPVWSARPATPASWPAATRPSQRAGVPASATRRSIPPNTSRARPEHRRKQKGNGSMVRGEPGRFGLPGRGCRRGRRGGRWSWRAARWCGGRARPPPTAAATAGARAGASRACRRRRRRPSPPPPPTPTRRGGGPGGGGGSGGGGGVGGASRWGAVRGRAIRLGGWVVGDSGGSASFPEKLEEVAVALIWERRGGAAVPICGGV